MTERETVSFPVFKDCKGERFVFPGLYSEGKSTGLLWGKCRQICCALGVDEEKEPLTIAVDAEGMLNFSHVKGRAGHKGFMHGSDEVWLVGGPTYDAIIAQVTT